MVQSIRRILSAAWIFFLSTSAYLHSKSPRLHFCVRQTVDLGDDAPSPLPRDFRDSVLQAFLSTENYFKSQKSARCIVEFDTSVNDVTYTSIKNTMPFLRGFSTHLSTSGDGVEGSSDTAKPLTVFFPDMGAAALARRDWMMQTNQSLVPSSISTASIQFDNPKESDLAAVIVCPLYSEVDNVQRIADYCTGRGIPCVLLNPALVNNDQGYGVRARYIRKTLLDTFETVYSLRTLQDGAVVRAWPRPYSVWREDSSAAEGYAHAGSTAAPPTAEMIRDMLQGRSAVPLTENGFFNFILESKKMWNGMSRL